LKPHVRVLGIDDSPFLFGDERALVVGAVVRLPGYLEGVMKAECQVDGDDADNVLAGMVNHSRFRDQIKMIMIDGVALCGFNVVDIGELFLRTGVPCATITRDPPHLGAMEEALREHFDDWEGRLQVIRSHPLHEVPTDHKPLYVAVEGMSKDEAAELIRGCTILGALPEPLRLAHIISTAMVMGESKGRA